MALPRRIAWGCLPALLLLLSAGALARTPAAATGSDAPVLSDADRAQLEDLARAWHWPEELSAAALEAEVSGLAALLTGRDLDALRSAAAAALADKDKHAGRALNEVLADALPPIDPPTDPATEPLPSFGVSMAPSPPPQPRRAVSEEELIVLEELVRAYHYGEEHSEAFLRGDRDGLAELMASGVELEQIQEATGELVLERDRHEGRALHTLVAERVKPRTPSGGAGRAEIEPWDDAALPPGGWSGIAYQDLDRMVAEYYADSEGSWAERRADLEYLNLLLDGGRDLTELHRAFERLRAADRSFDGRPLRAVFGPWLADEGTGALAETPPKAAGPAPNPTMERPTEPIRLIDGKFLLGERRISYGRASHLMRHVPQARSMLRTSRRMRINGGAMMVVGSVLLVQGGVNTTSMLVIAAVSGFGAVDFAFLAPTVVPGLILVGVGVGLVVGGSLELKRGKQLQQEAVDRYNEELSIELSIAPGAVGLRLEF